MTRRQIQFHGATSENRHTALFESLRPHVADRPRILSFGCSTGEEVLALSRTFPGADVLGAEVDPERIETARKLTGRQIAPLPELEGDFDLIAAMSVFCRWPKGVEPLPYDDFVSSLKEVANRVRPNGVFVVYNASYNIETVLLAESEFLRIEGVKMLPPPFVDVLDGGSGSGAFRKA